MKQKPVILFLIRNPCFVSIIFSTIVSISKITVCFDIISQYCCLHRCTGICRNRYQYKDNQKYAGNNSFEIFSHNHSPPPSHSTIKTSFSSPCSKAVGCFSASSFCHGKISVAVEIPMHVFCSCRKGNKPYWFSGVVFLIIPQESVIVSFFFSPGSQITRSIWWEGGQVDSDFWPVAESSRPLIQYDHRRTPHDQRRCPVGDDPYRQAPISILHDSFRIIVEDGFSQDTLRCVLEVMRNA